METKAAGDPVAAYAIDLGLLRDELLAEYFPGGRLRPSIGWASRKMRRTMGCYEHVDPASSGAILINPLLARREVPLFYLRYVIYHELVHAYVPPIRKGGRMYTHHRLFRTRERELRGFREALRWELEVLPLITD